MTNNNTIKNLGEEVKIIKKNKPWYSTTVFSVLALSCLALIDFGGFVQGGISYLGDLSRASITVQTSNILSTLVMLLGFTAAFEGSTIYMAYAFSIKLYHYDKQAIILSKTNKSNYSLSKFISTSSLGWISFICFILGVIANIIFRIGLYRYNIANFDGDEAIFESFIAKELALTLVMIILPIITSILNFVIGCFSFDPLLFEMNKSLKKISKLNIQNKEIENQINQIESFLKKIPEAKKNQEKNCAYKLACAASLRPVLRSRIYEQQMKGIK